MACREVDAAERSQALLGSACHLDAPCQYQASGPKSSPGQFIICDSTSDSAAPERRAHDLGRQHERFMTKKDSTGVKIPTCFFGDCAIDSGNGRDGPDFDTQDDRLAHVWSHHHVTAIKTPYVKYSEYRDTWLIEPYQWFNPRSRLRPQCCSAHISVLFPRRPSPSS
jgi:hypothetical protein